MAKVKDPVCGMMVEVNELTLNHQFEEVNYYFCSGDCLVKFSGDPNAYVIHEHTHCCREGKGTEQGHHEHHHHHGHCHNGHHHQHDPNHHCCRSNQK